MTRPYRKIVTGGARSTIAFIITLKLDEVGVSFGRYPGFNVSFWLNYLRYCD